MNELYSHIVPSAQRVPTDVPLYRAAVYRLMRRGDCTLDEFLSKVELTRAELAAKLEVTVEELEKETQCSST